MLPIIDARLVVLTTLAAWSDTALRVVAAAHEATCLVECAIVMVIGVISMIITKRGPSSERRHVRIALLHLAQAVDSNGVGPHLGHVGHQG